MVLIMSVEPGRGGQKFIDNSLNKIKKLKDYIKKNNLNVTEKSCIADYVIAICMSGIAVTEKVKIISLFEE